MSKRNPDLLIHDIHKAISKILLYTDGLTFQQYESDSKTVDAVERNFEIIGEAASRIPDEFKVLNTDIEWRILKDFRNFIIHEYFGVDNELVWNIIQKHLPALIIKIEVLIK